jgi:hypothetical protein
VITTLNMSFLNWLSARKPFAGKGAFARARNAFRTTTMPLISPRRGRRLLRREQLFAVVRESLIRGGVLSTSYSFKVLNLDANGDTFIALVDLALPAQSMPDEFLLEIERWIQQSAKSRHVMDVRGVYWRRKATPEQVGQALRAAVPAQTRDARHVHPTPGGVRQPRARAGRGRGRGARLPRCDQFAAGGDHAPPQRASVADAHARSGERFRCAQRHAARQDLILLRSQAHNRVGAPCGA